MEPRPEEPERTDAVPVPGPLPLVALVALAAAVVAVSANGLQLLQAPVELGFGWLWTVRAFGGVLVAVGAWALLRERSRSARGRGAPDPAVGGTRAAITIMGVVAVLGLLNPPPRTPRQSGRQGAFGFPSSSFGIDLPGRGALPAQTRGGESGIQGESLTGEPAELMPFEFVAGEGGGILRRMRGLLPQLLLIAILLLAMRYLSQQMSVRHRTLSARIPVPPAKARAGLEASLRAVTEYGPDPRGQITLAYHRLLAALEEAGAPRELYEAPHEHLHRALGPLGVRPEPLHGLAEIFVAAQFGGRPVTARHQAEAADALAVSLAALRSSPPRPRPDGGGLELRGAEA